MIFFNLLDTENISEDIKRVVLQAIEADRIRSETDPEGATKEVIIERIENQTLDQSSLNNLDARVSGSSTPVIKSSKTILQARNSDNTNISPLELEKQIGKAALAESRSEFTSNRLTMVDQSLSKKIKLLETQLEELKKTINPGEKSTVSTENINESSITDEQFNQKVKNALSQMSSNATKLDIPEKIQVKYSRESEYKLT